MNFTAYLIHYSKYSDRMLNMEHVFSTLGISHTVISDWDQESIGHYSQDLSLWQQRISHISDILVANSVSTSFSTYSDALTYASHLDSSNTSWINPRLLGKGEISVLLKHRMALERIAFGEQDFGIIFEDDIFVQDNSKTQLFSLLNSWNSLDGAYLDIAGGAGLTADNDLSLHINDLLYHCQPARTRTNACYCVSKQLALRVLNLFFPLVFPIDWHLQYILHTLKEPSCYWSIEPPLIHGSENGLVKSWRS